jgi:hypothetical protein
MKKLLDLKKDIKESTNLESESNVFGIYFAPELFELIFSFLGAEDIIRSQRVSKEFLKLTNMDSVWKRLCLSEGIDYKPDDITWKTIYLQKFIPIKYKIQNLF